MVKPLWQYLLKCPGGRVPPYAPFATGAVNLGACSDGHTDNDLMCAVISFPEDDTVGGALCLYPAKLIFDLGTVFVAVFRSCEMLHFNEHVKGLRNSLVLYTEKASANWMRDQNVWKGTGYIQ